MMSSRPVFREIVCGWFVEEMISISKSTGAPKWLCGRRDNCASFKANKVNGFGLRTCMLIPPPSLYVGIYVCCLAVGAPG